MPALEGFGVARALAAHFVHYVQLVTLNFLTSSLPSTYLHQGPRSTINRYPDFLSAVSIEAHEPPGANEEAFNVCMAWERWYQLDMTILVARGAILGVPTGSLVGAWCAWAIWALIGPFEAGKCF